jgi:hypothetical protein
MADPDMTSRPIEHYRARNEDAPLDLVRESDAWKPVVRLIDGWAKEKLGPTSGYSSKELDLFSLIQGARFPPVLREWWRLAGRHPFVTTGLVPGNARFLRPDDRQLFSRRRDFLVIAVDDEQTWSGNGIHIDFMSDADPQVHGINDTIRPSDAPRLDWYKGMFIATGLRVPALIFTTLLYHLFEPSPLVRDEAIHLEQERRGLSGRNSDERFISKLGLKPYMNITTIGNIYSNGEDIIYWWMMGWTCRSAEAAERVCRAAPGLRKRSRE